MSNEANPTPVESQKDRRLKYGAVVGLTIVIAVLLGTAVVVLAERKPKRVDTTFAGLYSLKPQTLNIIGDNRQKVRITSLYTKAKAPEQAQDAPVQGAPPKLTDAEVADQSDKVTDLLEEYRSKGKNIEVETIDPVANPGKIDDLTAEVSEKYGGQVAKYKKFLGTEKEAGTATAEIKALQDALDAEATAVRALPFAAVKSEDVVDNFQEVYSSLRNVAADLKALPNSFKPDLREKPPLYKKAADKVKASTDLASQQLGALADFFGKLKDAKFFATLPAPLQKYVTDGVVRFATIKKQADDLSKEVTDLGELKLDTLSTALKQRNSILVRGESDWKVIPYEQVWKVEQPAPGPQPATVKPPRFAGEQMITAAIWTLEHPQKLKVAFVRAGGAALTQPEMMPFFAGGPYADWAEELRQYNYDVVEKDLTGMSQMQQQQGMNPPEPSDEEIKDAVWVVYGAPAGQQNPMGGGPPTISPKVMEHLSAGGSAMILGDVQGDDFSLALKEFGVEMRTSAVIMHEVASTDGAKGTDLEEALRRNPTLVKLSSWGDSPVTKPLGSLSGVAIRAVPVKITPTPGVKSWPIIPIPTDVKTWAETDLQGASNGPPTYDPAKDLPNAAWPAPLHVGAVAEKEGKGRLVVIGSWVMQASGVLRFRDSEGNRRSLEFPGNHELSMDSIFWLSRQEPMIAISPAAMDVSRIDTMSRGAQNFWRGGVLLAILPLFAVLCGVGVFIARRD